MRLRSIILNKQQALDLWKAGYKSVGRYLTGTVGTDFRPKALTVAEIKRITSAGLHIFPIYQDGGYYLNYFKNPSQGSTDATIAIQTATRLGFLHGTTIYFAVDFDCLPHETDDYIIKYFQEIYGVFNSSLNGKQYKIGVYGPRQICIALADKMLTTSSFVSDMSSGFTGNCGYPLPKNWAFDQFFETTFASSPSFAIDKVARSLEPGKDQGCINFDEVEYITEQERINALYKKYLNNFTSATAPLENIFTANIDLYDCRIQVAHFPSTNMEINLFIETKGKAVVAPNSPSKFTIPIELNSDGTVTANFEETLKQVLSEIDTSGFLEQFYDMAFEKCISIAKEMQEGNVTLQVKLKEPNCAELSVTWESNEVYLPGDGEGSESRYLELSIGWIVQVMIYTPEYKLAGEIVKYASVACVGCIAGWALVELGAVAGAGLGTITTIYSGLDAILKLLERASIILRN
ncbi:glycoside hydrolase domain-containing protein [Mediterraneibacter sp.]|uniref:glycoside hydrolase domain-containing protein n=1 Tax=Mediterraneibacter sp. TaxID=2316022 RepID=UPI003991C570